MEREKFYPEAPEFPSDLDELGEGPFDGRDPEAALDYRPGYCTACNGSGWPRACLECGDCDGTNYVIEPKKCSHRALIRQMVKKPCEACEGTGRAQDALHLDGEF